MRERGLKAIQPRNFVPKTRDGRADRPSLNLLLDHPLPQTPNALWAGDITYIPTGKGWLYLAVVIDVCSRRIAGWSRAGHLRAPLLGDALRQALGSRSVPKGLIFHSDRGSQYGSREFRRLLEQDGCFIDAADARIERFAYIDSCYNAHRRHSSLEYQTPAEFEAQISSLN